jgi:hypothetical protein
MELTSWVSVKSSTPVVHSAGVLLQVIVIDWNSDSLKFHPRNMLRLPRWKGNDDDQTLVDLGTFLRSRYTWHTIQSL